MFYGHRSLLFVATILGLLLGAQQTALTHDLGHLAARTVWSTVDQAEGAHDTADQSLARGHSLGAAKAGYCEHCFVYAQLGALASGAAIAIPTVRTVFDMPPPGWHRNPLVRIRHALGRGPPSGF